MPTFHITDFSESKTPVFYDSVVEKNGRYYVTEVRYIPGGGDREWSYKSHHRDWDYYKMGDALVSSLDLDWRSIQAPTDYVRIVNRPDFISKLRLAREDAMYR